MVLFQERNGDEPHQVKPKNDDDAPPNPPQPFLDFIGNRGKDALQQNPKQGKNNGKAKDKENTAEKYAPVFFIMFSNPHYYP